MDINGIGSYGYRYGYGFDSTYILVIIGAVLCLICSAFVKSTFNKYANVASMSGITGAEAAARILKENGLYDVKIARVAGSLTDNYNPATKVLNLSESVHDSTSIAAISVAAHECGHAMQHDEGYFPLTFRSKLVPLANFGSKFGLWIVILGLVISFLRPLTTVGIILFFFGVLFQIVTLPVEFDASKRALETMQNMNMVTDSEITGARKVLRSAAMTYVASAAAAILSLLRLILLSRGNKRRD